MGAAAAAGGNRGQQQASSPGAPGPAVQQMEVEQLAEVLYNPALVRGLPLYPATLPPPHSAFPAWLSLRLSGLPASPQYLPPPPAPLWCLGGTPALLPSACPPHDVS